MFVVDSIIFSRDWIKLFKSEKQKKIRKFYKSTLVQNVDVDGFGYEFTYLNSNSNTYSVSSFNFNLLNEIIPKLRNIYSVFI